MMQDNLKALVCDAGRLLYMFGGRKCLGGRFPQCRSVYSPAACLYTTGTLKINIWDFWWLEHKRCTFDVNLTWFESADWTSTSERRQSDIIHTKFTFLLPKVSTVCILLSLRSPPSCLTDSPFGRPTLHVGLQVACERALAIYDGGQLFNQDNISVPYVTQLKLYPWWFLLTRYMYIMCLPFGVLFYQVWYSDWGFIADEGTQFT